MSDETTSVAQRDKSNGFLGPLATTESWVRRIVLVLTAVAILTTSFDIAGNLEVAGYNVRITQLASLPLVFLGIRSVLRGKDNWVVGGLWLLAWCAVQLLLSFRSPSITNGIGYWCWLMLDACIVFGLPALAQDDVTYRWLAKVYLNSFFVLAVFGLLQFALYYAGVNVYLAQVIKGGLARINGLSYEPSYYATYLFMGFVLNGYLLEKEDFSLLSKVALIRNYVLIVLAIVLTNSRMAYLVMALWFVLRMGAMIVNAIRARKEGGKARLPLYFWITLACMAAGVMLLVALGMNYKTLMRGFGIVGKNSQSADDRLAGLTTCLQVFGASPLLGYGLGGVDPAIAQFRGAAYQGGDNGAAMSIAGELLVANGIVGMIPFVGYLWSLFFGDKRHVRDPESPWHTLHLAMLWALAFEFIILLFNQNILRPYLWMHIAFVAASWNHARKAVA